MRAYKTIFLPQINYAQKAIWNNSKKGNEFTTKWLYQNLKTLSNIKHNLRKEILFENLNLDSRGFPKQNKILKPIINYLSTKVIKLRTGCLFNKYNKNIWKCSHPKNTKDTIRNCQKLAEWRNLWSKRFK